MDNNLFKNQHNFIYFAEQGPKLPTPVTEISDHSEGEESNEDSETKKTEIESRAEKAKTIIDDPKWQTLFSGMKDAIKNALIVGNHAVHAAHNLNDKPEPNTPNPDRDHDSGKKVTGKKPDQVTDGYGNGNGGGTAGEGDVI